jgi:hypothetical protein
MSNHNHHYRESDFNAEQTAAYTLLVKIGLASFSYAVTGHNRVMVLEENIPANELIEQTEKHPLLFATYKERIVSLPQNGFTFIPVSLFRPDHAADYARFLDVKENDKVFSQALDAENQVIYKTDKQIINIAATKFDIRNTVFSAKGWITLTAANNPADHNLYVNIDNDKVEFLNFKGGKLRFYNAFEFKTADELAYFTLFVTGELELSPQATTLLLSGDVNINDDNAVRLNKFFGKVEINHLKTVDLPWEITSHSVLTLTALSLCGSSEAL